MSSRCALLFLLLLPSAAAAQGHPEFVIGADNAGKLVVKFDATKPYPLRPSPFQWIEGYADVLPGFATPFDLKPEEGFSSPDPKSNLAVILLGADEGMNVWNDHGTGTMKNGEAFVLGNPPFDSHPVWNVAKGSAIKPYKIRLQVRDVTGRLKESDPFAATFLPDEGKESYACPMRCKGGPISERPGKCAECGMALKLLSGRTYRVTVKPEGALRAGEEAFLRFRIETPDGKPVIDLEVVHEKLLHLLLVSNDLAWFAHEHPELQPDGSMTLKQTFPHGGDFTLFHDFTPARVGMQVVPVELHVEGAAPAPTPLAVSPSRSQLVDGVKVDFESSPVLASIRMERLTFRLSRDGKPLTDLEPFLGAMGHLIMISEDRAHFVHSHPLETKGRKTGPDVTFDAQFPVPGLYKAWAQFQHRGKVITAPFTVRVVSPRDAAAPAPGK